MAEEGLEAEKRARARAKGAMPNSKEVLNAAEFAGEEGADDVKRLVWN
jgi:hypothetical protein